MLQKIREDFINDGLRWSLDPDQKLVHLWRKLQRTEEAFRSSRQEINSLKTQQKKEMAELEDFVSNIRKLSQEKEQLTLSLEQEKESLRAQLRQVCLERDTFIQENQTIAELLLDEGLNQFAGSTPIQPVEHLLQERSEHNAKIQQLEAENAHLVEELANTASNFKREREVFLNKAQKDSTTMDQRLKAMKEAHMAEQANMARERDRYKSESEENHQKLKLLQTEVKGLKSKLASEERGHAMAMKKLTDELEGTCVSPCKPDPF